MTTRSDGPRPPTPRPLSNWTIAVGALVVLAIAAVVWYVLLRRYGGQTAQVQLDAIRTTGTLVIGTGGAMALLLTARRQRYSELTLVHTDSDATERRITELYSKAADQLGSDQAPVRLAGLYSLERLAHSTVEHRQTMVDVICAYLRMPYTPAPQSSGRVLGRSHRSQRPSRRPRILTDRPSRATATSGGSRQEHAQQERQVRLTAQNILFRNLRVTTQRRRRRWRRTPRPSAPTWPGIRLDLTGALLLEFSLSECQLDYADFTDAQFIGDADFEGAQFTDEVYFEGAQFTGMASFMGVQFADMTYFRYAQFADGTFDGARFTGRAYFEGAQFTGRASYEYARFGGGASFGEAQFIGAAVFEDARFSRGAFFEGAQFADKASFAGAQFDGWALFEGAQFDCGASFGGARVGRAAKPGTVWPPDWTTRRAELDLREDPAFVYLTMVEEGDSQDV